jgi:hypothetical protein
MLKARPKRIRSYPPGGEASAEGAAWPELLPIMLILGSKNKVRKRH